LRGLQNLFIWFCNKKKRTIPSAYDSVIIVICLARGIYLHVTCIEVFVNGIKILALSTWLFPSKVLDSLIYRGFKGQLADLCCSEFVRPFDQLLKVVQHRSIFDPIRKCFFTSPCLGQPYDSTGSFLTLVRVKDHDTAPSQAAPPMCRTTPTPKRSMLPVPLSICARARESDIYMIPTRSTMNSRT